MAIEAPQIEFCTFIQLMFPAALSALATVFPAQWCMFLLWAGNLLPGATLRYWQSASRDQTVRRSDECPLLSLPPGWAFIPPQKPSLASRLIYEETSGCELQALSRK